MRRDLIIGIIVAFTVLGGTAGVGEWLKPDPKKVVKQEEEHVIALKMPPLEPDDPEPKEVDETPAPTVDFAPPMQNDVPQQIQIDSFVQQLQPPPPEGLQPVTGVINIPQGRLVAGAGLGQIFDLSQLDKIPQATVQAKPVYPFEMRRAGITGTVVVEFIVDKTGAVLNATARPSAQREFEAEAVKAVSKWKFRPGQRGGQPVPTHMVVPIVFSLNDD
ncbi:MAG TPA: energy transducer TonB [Opitutaceae bacterium]|nr:energy transducer TonB [Opitutaceae bacterium]